MCAFRLEISSFFGRSFPFLFPFFVIHAMVLSFPYGLSHIHIQLYTHSVSNKSLCSEYENNVYINTEITQIIRIFIFPVFRTCVSVLFLIFYMTDFVYASGTRPQHKEGCHIGAGAVTKSCSLSYLLSFEILHLTLQDVACSAFQSNMCSHRCLHGRQILHVQLNVWGMWNC